MTMLNGTKILKDGYISKVMNTLQLKFMFVQRIQKIIEHVLYIEMKDCWFYAIEINGIN
jgi:hypothetical protein